MVNKYSSVSFNHQWIFCCRVIHAEVSVVNERERTVHSLLIINVINVLYKLLLSKAMLQRVAANQIQRLLDNKFAMMKNIVLLLLSLAMVTADEHCQNLIKQCNMVRTTCNPGVLTISSCCDLINFPVSVAPSIVYEIDLNCSDVCADNFTTANMFIVT